MKGDVQARLLEQRGFLLMTDSAKRSIKTCSPSEQGGRGWTAMEASTSYWLCGLWYLRCADVGGRAMFPGSPVPAVAVLTVLES